MAWTPNYVEEVRRSMEMHLSDLMPLPITRINARLAALALRSVTKSAPDMAKKVRQRLRAVIEHAVRAP